MRPVLLALQAAALLLSAAVPALADPIETATPAQDAAMRAAVAEANRLREVNANPQLLAVPPQFRLPASAGAATTPPVPPAR